jgi:BirA family transcriptional regulator, biotin operon repressor / biotin---[acetyl-CoA-carboxylase] ligase
MATPYLQTMRDVVPSTQDLARSELADLPVVVIAPGQTEGRGRAGANWINADRALAVSVAWTAAEDDRPFSLMAGVAATRALGDEVRLKWPNDLLSGGNKVGGILVERSGEVVVCGMGVNLYWDAPPDGMGALASEDPGPERHKEVGALWAAEFMTLLDQEDWPIEEYREVCSTLGREITWEPNGSGLAAGISPSGALLVETTAGIEELFAGAVSHVRG